MHPITTCPICRSQRIKKVRKSVTRMLHGRPFIVPGVAFHECPGCGERIFSPEAVHKIRMRSREVLKPTA